MIRIQTFVSLFVLIFSSSALLSNSYEGTTSVFVSYSNAAKNNELEHSPKINISFDGSEHYTPFVMDTGSVGIIASSDIFKPAPDAKNLGKGFQYYSSSGIIEEGTWWSSTQKIYDAEGNLLATSNVPVLQVTSVSCAKHARFCEPKHHPKGISMMGIGFSRESKQQVRGTPEYNPFLNLQSVQQNGKLVSLPSNWCNGYVVTSKGVELGLTALNTANAGWVKLKPKLEYTTPKLSEWTAAPMTLNINGTSGNGHILMDTGVGTAYLTPPFNALHETSLAVCHGSSKAQCLPNGTKIDIYLPDQKNPVAYYSFTTGGDNPMRPEGVHIVKGADVFFNSSRHVLKGMDVIYDNTNGYIGYIWKGNGSTGYVKPATLISTTTLQSISGELRVSVTGTDPSKIPTGSVTFFIDHFAKEMVDLDESGKATYRLAPTDAKEHFIEAKYSGDANYIRSSASRVNELAPPKSH